MIKVFVLEDSSATEIHTNIVSVLNQSGLPFASVHRWVSEFEGGHISVEDEPRSGRQKKLLSING